MESGMKTSEPDDEVDKLAVLSSSVGVDIRHSMVKHAEILAVRVGAAMVNRFWKHQNGSEMLTKQQQTKK